MPASTSASVLPAWPMMLVFGPVSAQPAERLRGTAFSPIALLTPAERTQRLRYHSAFPSRMRTPCTMPSPVNQW